MASSPRKKTRARELGPSRSASVASPPSGPRVSFAAVGPLLWLAVLCTALFSWPELMSGNYLPKTFVASLTLGVGFLLVPPRRPAVLGVTLFGLLWALYAAWALLSILWAPAGRVVVERWAALMVPTVAYLLARRVRFWESEVFWDGFCLLLALIAAIGICQINPGGLLPASLHKAAGWFAGTAVPRATLGHRNYASLFLMFGVPFFVWRYYKAERIWRSVLALGVLAAVLVFILYARTRGVWIGTSLVFGFLLAGGWRKALSKRRRSMVLVVGVMLAAVFAITHTAAFLSRIGAKGSLSTTVSDLADPSNRLPMWGRCFGKTSPLIGGGFGCFPIHGTPHAADAKVLTLNWEVHNDYLQAFVDLGVPGVLLFCAALGVALWLAWRRRSDALVLAAGAALVGVCFVQFTTFLSEKISSQLMFAGTLALIVHRTDPRLLWRKPVGRVPAFLLGWALGLLLLLYALAAWRTMWGDWQFRSTNAMIGEISRLNQIVLHPKKHSPADVQEAKVQGARLYPRFQQRLQWLADYVLPRMPLDANMRHITAHTFAGTAIRARNLPAAESFARAALKLHHNDHTAMGVLASTAFERKQYKESTEWLEKAVALKEPESRMGMEMALAKTYAAGGRIDQAVQLLERDLTKLGELGNPYSEAQQLLVQLLMKKGDRRKAANLRKMSERNRVAMPELRQPAVNAVLRAEAGSGGARVHFEWAAVPAAHRYRLIVNRSGKNLWEQVADVYLDANETTISLPACASGVRYSWCVEAMGEYRMVRTGRQNFLVSGDSE